LAIKLLSNYIYFPAKSKTLFCLSKYEGFVEDKHLLNTTCAFEQFN